MNDEAARPASVAPPRLPDDPAEVAARAAAMRRKPLPFHSPERPPSPLDIDHASPAVACRIIRKLWRDPERRIVLLSERRSHYDDY